MYVCVCMCARTTCMYVYTYFLSEVGVANMCQNSRHETISSSPWQSCEEELRSLVSRVNEGEFVDPSAPPYELIDQLESLKEVVMGVRARLLGLSKWKEAITGQPHNLSTVSR